MDQLFTALANFLNLAVTSKTGTAVAAVVLSTLLYLVQRVPFVSDLLSKSAFAKQAAMIFLAVAPAVVVTLSSKASWYEALVTAVLTFLTATGVQSLTSPKPVVTE